ncbi:MAG: polysaccharide deacetylase family protein [Bacteroidetes bacterium]|nr:polysaccharide deacetylase family protein [Bacteroidota bacterium]
MKEKSLLLTFDDGYENNYKFAFPILKKYNAPATIFLISSLINSNNPTWYDLIDNTRYLFNNQKHINEISKLVSELGLNSQKNMLHKSFKQWLKSQSIQKKNEILEKYLSIIGIKSMNNIDEKYWKILSSEQILTMQKSGLISFGSHTVKHPNLDQINNDEVELELKDSKSKIENILGKKINTIAFPDGAYNESVKNMTKEAGYTNIYAVNYRCESDQNDTSILNRYSISNTTTAESVITNICVAFSQSRILKK